MEEIDRDALDAAYDLINDYLDELEDEYLDVHYSGHTDCLVERLAGGTTGTGATLIRESENEHDWAGTNLWGSRYMLLAWNYLRGITNSFDDEEGDDDKQLCIILGLARTVLHESTHSCWRVLEKFAYITEYWLAREVSKDRGVTTEDYCCTPDPLEDGYDQDDYRNSSEVIAAGDNWAFHEEVDGRWVLENPCG